MGFPGQGANEPVGLGFLVVRPPRLGDVVRAAMETLAASLSPEELNRRGFALYEEFRPEVPAGAQGWGAVGMLDLDHIVALAEEMSPAGR